jgi:hypothetical protein
MANIVCQRPMGRISLSLTACDAGVHIARHSSDFFGSSSSELTLAHPFETTQSALQAWAKGALAQDALGFMSACEREWLISGFLPGHEFNPID